MKNIASFIWIILTLVTVGFASEDEKRLVNFLFHQQEYNPLIRPAKEVDEVVTVNFGLALIQLISLDEVNQYMKTNVWWRLHWVDEQLKWTPEEFGNIGVIRVAPETIWNPDIVMFNNADGRYEVGFKCNALIYPTGDIYWIPPGIFKSSCTIDVEYFPFDEQTCDMVFGSWTFNGDQVNLTWYPDDKGIGIKGIDMNDYVTSGSWDVVDAPACIKYDWDPLDEHHKSTITYRVVLRRKTLFYVVNVIMPCVLIGFLSIFTFLLPGDEQEKFGSCVSILLALVVFMLLVSNILPPTSIKIPLILKFLLFCFIMTLISIVISICTVHCNWRTPRTHLMPVWVRAVFLNYLPRFLLMRRPNHEERSTHKTFIPNNIMEGVAVFNPAAIAAPYTDMPETHHPDCLFKLSEGHTAEAMNEKGELDPNLHKAIESVRFIAAHMKNEDDYSEIVEDWKYIAAVLDRLFLFIFLACIVGGTTSILISAPNVFNHVNQTETIKYIIDRQTEPQCWLDGNT